MGKNRIEAFSDGVLAIIITIMVLELKVPHDVSLAALSKLAPVFLSYVLSFIYIGIYWNNHHHLMHSVHHVNGSILWPNLHLLFWLSLVPFASGWMGENQFALWPVVLYGFVLMMSAIAYAIFSNSLMKLHGQDSVVAKAIGRDRKGRFSILINAVAIALAFVSPWLSLALYVLVAVIWFIPDRRIEKVMAQ